MPEGSGPVCPESLLPAGELLTQSRHDLSARGEQLGAVGAAPVSFTRLNSTDSKFVFLSTLHADSHKQNVIQSFKPCLS